MLKNNRLGVPYTPAEDLPVAKPDICRLIRILTLNFVPQKHIKFERERHLYAKMQPKYQIIQMKLQNHKVVVE